MRDLKLSTLAANLDVDVGGIWRPCPYGPEGFTVRIARGQNPEFVRLHAEYLSQVEKSSPDPSTETEEEVGARVKAAARAIVTDWRGLRDDDKNDVPYSPEVAEILLSDDKFYKFRNWVAVQSRRDEIFEAARLDRDGELLGNVSGGSSSGDPTLSDSEE